jgi:hypothetical protein
MATNPQTQEPPTRPRPNWSPPQPESDTQPKPPRPSQLPPVHGGFHPVTYPPLPGPRP